MTDDVAGVVSALRASFDGAFAVPPPAARKDQLALLAVRVGAEPVALRVLETGGLLPARALVPVPSRRPELLGVAGLRGAILPVYGLARLLGLPEPAEPPRWIALAGGAERIGLAFSAFEGHVLVAAADLAPVAGGAGGRHVDAVVRVGGAPRPVLSVPSLVRAITRHPGAAP